LRPVERPAGAAFEKRILLVAVWLAAAAVVAQTASHAAFVLAFDADPDWNQLNAGVDRHAWAWLSGSVTFGAALALFLLALAAPRIRAGWILVACGLAYMSLDDVVAIHEGVGLRLSGALDRPEDWARPLWVAVFLPLLAVTFAGLVSVSREASRDGRQAIRLGLGLLVAAIVLEVSTMAFVTGVPDEGGHLYATEVALEEGVELGGWILIAGALASMLRAAPGRSE
jgi:hypothetical protein